LEKVGRPLLGAQIFAVALCLMAATAFLLSQVSKGFDWLARVEELPRALHLEALLPAAWQNTAGVVWMALAVIGVLALAGGVIAFAAPDKR
jgi:hypothetical protein